MEYDMAVKKRKTVATKKMVKKIREERKKIKNTSSYQKKKTVVAGPWTNITTKLKVKVSLRAHNGLMGESYGTYPSIEMWHEPGWYPIIFNLMSKEIQAEVEKYGINEYLAACEVALNLPENKKKYGNVVFLEMQADNSQNEDKSRRFISMRAKTNKKNIIGFTAIRKGIYKVLE